MGQAYTYQPPKDTKGGTCIQMFSVAHLAPGFSSQPLGRKNGTRLKPAF